MNIVVSAEIDLQPFGCKPSSGDAHRWLWAQQAKAFLGDGIGSLPFRHRRKQNWMG